MYAFVSAFASLLCAVSRRMLDDLKKTVMALEDLGDAIILLVVFRPLSLLWSSRNHVLCVATVLSVGPLAVHLYGNLMNNGKGWTRSSYEWYS